MGASGTTARDSDRGPLALALLLCLAAGPAEAADLEGQARVWLGPGFDSNARRDYVSGGNGTTPDLYLYGLGEVAGTLRVGERLTVRGGYQLGGRAFLFLGSESTVLQDAQLSAQLKALDWLRLGVVGRARDRRGADRSYTDLQGGLSVEVVPDAHLVLSLAVEAHRFLYWDGFEVSFFGPDSALTASYRFDRHHGVSLWGQWSPRTYNALAKLPPPTPDGIPGTSNLVRTDTVLGAGVSYSYRGPVHLSLSYGYLDDASSSYGQTLRRHRLGVAAGVPLPWELTALASGTLQLMQFPDGVYLSPDLLVADDENASSVTAKLVRALGPHLELDLRYAFYFNQMPAKGFFYRRHVLSLGVALSY